MRQNASLPLVVDLDGTLVLTDTLHELAIGQARRHPLAALQIPAWLAQGKARLKQQLAQHVPLDVETLPYNTELLAWLKAEQQAGRTLVLCTAADIRVADAVAQYLGIFSEVIASDGHTNLSAGRKAEQLVSRFGDKGFDYAGNSQDDLAVWARARHAVVVNASKTVTAKAERQGNVALTLPQPATDMRLLHRMLRTHQWLKNLLLFVPLLASHQFGNWADWATLVVAFFAFSLCASAVYIANDLLDLPSDRQHPRKRLRPFASGRIPVAYGVAIAPLLLVASVALAVWVGASFVAWLVVYFAITCLYSVLLKRLVLLDCMTLASLYTLRVMAGATAVGLASSEWLLAVSGFVFLSLSFLKRYTELQMLAASHADALIHGRGYRASDAALVQVLGIASGFASAVVLALYLHGAKVLTMYRFPDAILLTVAVLVYWISWMWLKAHRGEMHDDPVFFAIKDRVSLACGAAFALSLALGTVGLPW